MIDVAQITELHRTTVDLWHSQAISNAYSGFLESVCEQHKYNFLLWHEEDIARSPDVGDDRIAAVKRAIERYNQPRNDGIQQMDDFRVQERERRGIKPQVDAPLNADGRHWPQIGAALVTVGIAEHYFLQRDVPRAIGPVALGRHRAKQRHARSSHGDGQVQGTGVRADEQPRAAHQGGQFPQARG